MHNIVHSIQIGLDLLNKLHYVTRDTVVYVENSTITTLVFGAICMAMCLPKFAFLGTWKWRAHSL